MAPGANWNTRQPGTCRRAKGNYHAANANFAGHGIGPLDATNPLPR